MKIDKALITNCVNGDRRSQSKLYELTFSHIMSIASRYYVNREDAISCVNGCFLKILLGLESFSNQHGVKSYFSWSKKIMMNLLIDEFRKHKNDKNTLNYLEDASYLDQLLPEEYNAIEQMMHAESLQNMLGELTETQRSIFNLFAIDGYSHKEIADALEISTDNSKYHLSQARKCLQLILKREIEKQKNKLDA
jgi:RNA polymerase sigma-70 factor (ECF subfamily)